MNQSIGKTIQKIRKMKGLTQKALGRECGIAEQTISQYERGSRNPKPETQKKIAAALGVTPEDFLNPQNFENNIEQKYIEKMGYSIEAENRNVRIVYKNFQITMTKKEWNDFHHQIKDYIEAIFAKSWLKTMEKRIKQECLKEDIQ